LITSHVCPKRPGKVPITVNTKSVPMYVKGMFRLMQLTIVATPVVNRERYIPVAAATAGGRSITKRKGLKISPPPIPAQATRNPPTREATISKAIFFGVP